MRPPPPPPPAQQLPGTSTATAVDDKAREVMTPIPNVIFRLLERQPRAHCIPNVFCGVSPVLQRMKDGEVARTARLGWPRPKCTASQAVGYSRSAVALGHSGVGLGCMGGRIPFLTSPFPWSSSREGPAPLQWAVGGRGLMVKGQSQLIYHWANDNEGARGTRVFSEVSGPPPWVWGGYGATSDGPTCHTHPRLRDVLATSCTVQRMGPHTLPRANRAVER